MSEINAIATNNFILHNIDAKKLYVQEPLFTANSGDAVYVGWRPDETVLWENTNKTSTRLITWPQQLSESIDNFDYVDVYYNGDGTSEFSPRIHNFSTSGNGYYNLFDVYNPPNTNNIFYRLCKLKLNGTAMSVDDNFTYNFPNGDNNHTGYNVIYKVVGINRKENA
jgi:hypothetical protein